jgi:DeoR/GlpR family transcriptional regulator of sugar metabolism
MTKLSPAERERQILNLITSRGSASIEELAQACSVSTMTIHRDLQRLEKMGRIQKRHGGAIVAESIVSHSACAMCGKTSSGKQTFIIHFKQGDPKHACCAHCGLMLLSASQDVWQAMTMDFLHGHMISAGQAIYLIGCDLNVCCVPTILTFGAQTEAERFQSGFGGTLANMEEAIHSLLGAHPKER